MPFVLVVDEDDDPGCVSGDCLATVRVPYRADPLSILSVEPPRGAVAAMSFREQGLLAAALLAEAYGLRGTSARAVLRSRNKLVMRRLLAGVIDQPAFGLLDDSSPQEDMYPLVVKPLDGEAGQDVVLIQEPDDLPSGGPWLWERYLPDPEFSVEAVSAEGKHRILGLTEKIVSEGPSFVELGHRVPARLTRSDERALVAAVTACLDALEIDLGPTHTEVKLAGAQATIIETHTRPGGDRIPRLTELVTGVDQYDAAVRAFLGLPPSEPAEAPYAAAGIAFCDWKPGTVTRVEGLAAARALSGIEEVELTLPTTGEVAERKSNFDRVGHVVAGGSSLAEVEARLAAAWARVEAVYADRPGARRAPVPA